MAGIDLPPGSAGLSEVKRKLFNSYLRGDLVPAERESERMTRRPLHEPARLSLTQEQLWYREQIEGIPPLYNESITVRRNGPWDVFVLERSLAEIVRRHEIWRTVYETSNGVPVQVVRPAPGHFPLRTVDVRGLKKAEVETEILRISTQETRRRFDLRRGPLLRATLFRLEDEDYRLFIAAHLSILDGVSVYNVFPVELATLYAAFSAGKPSPLAEPSIQYGDYANWQRRTFRGTKLTEQLTHWRTQLAEAPIPRWPARDPKLVSQSYRGATHKFSLDSDLTSALNEFRYREGVTLFTILVASFSILVSRYTGQLDVVLGMPSPAGRKRPETQLLLGYFLNPVALRIDLSGDPTVRELLWRVQKVLATSICYDDVPMEVLASALRGKANTEPNPFFTTAISLHPKTPNAADGWSVTSMDADSGGAPWDFYLAFIDGPNGIVGRIQYNPDLLGATAVTEVLSQLQLLLRSVSDDSGQCLLKASKNL